MEVTTGERGSAIRPETRREPSATTELMEVTVTTVVFSFNGTSLRVLGLRPPSNTEPLSLPKYSFRSGMSFLDAAHLAVRREAGLHLENFFQVGAFTLTEEGQGKQAVEVCFFSLAKLSDVSTAVQAAANATQFVNSSPLASGMGTHPPAAAVSTLAEPGEVADLLGSHVLWIPIEELANFDGISRARVESATQELRRRARFESIAFSLLPEEFSLSELQKMFEAVLGRAIDVRNFRKKIESLGILLESPNKPRGMAYRPPRLFTFSPERFAQRLENEGEVRFF